MDFSTVVFLILAVVLLISVGFMKNRMNDVEDRVEILESHFKDEAVATVKELQAVRHENSRLRRALKEHNDDEDVFPAREHTKAVKFVKRGGTSYDDQIINGTGGAEEQN